MAIGPHAESEAEVLEKHETKGAVAGRIPVTVVTPRGPVAEREVDEIVAPGSEGEFGVLPGHVAFLSALKPGVLTIRTGTTREVLAVGSGYLEVGAGGATRVLVESAAAPDDIDVDEVKTELTELDEQLRAIAAGSREGSSLLLAKQAWAQARLAAVAAAKK